MLYLVMLCIVLLYMYMKQVHSCFNACVYAPWFENYPRQEFEKRIYHKSYTNASLYTCTCFLYNINQMKICDKFTYVYCVIPACVLLFNDGERLTSPLLLH